MARNTFLLIFIVLSLLGCSQGDPQREYQTDFPEESGFYFNEVTAQRSTFYPTFFGYFDAFRRELTLMREPFPDNSFSMVLTGDETIITMNLDYNDDDFQEGTLNIGSYESLTTTNFNTVVNSVGSLNIYFEMNAKREDSHMSLETGTVNVEQIREGTYSITYELNGSWTKYNSMQTEPIQILGRFESVVTMIPSPSEGS